MKIDNVDTVIARGADELERVYRGDHIIVWEPGGHDYSHDYFTIEALGNGNIVWGLDAGKTVQYSKNGVNWLTMDGNTVIQVSTGDKVYFKGTNPSYGESIASSASFNVKGNIMSLIYDDSFETATAVGGSAFSALFSGCTLLRSAEHLQLPATTLSNCSYCMMFNSCTGLTKAPELPATSLAEFCYGGMFSGCTSLATAPVLPATTLADYCYQGMFLGCTSLVAAPVLPAVIMRRGCYATMFQGCTSLQEVKCLAMLAETNCFQNWLLLVSQTGTFYKVQGIQYPSGGDGIPSGWAVVDLD